MDTAAFIEKLEAAGMEPAAILVAVKAHLALEKDALEKRRAGDRERQARHRAKDCHVMSRDITVTECDTPSPLVPPLSPAPLTPPLIPPTPNSPDADFEEFWECYPRKESKGQARKAFKAAIRKTSLEMLKAAARAYSAKMAGEDAKFVKHGATWLNAECWQDASIKPQVTVLERREGFYVKPSTDEMDAWDAYLKTTTGRSSPRDSKGGWWHSSQWPPTTQEKAA